MNISRKILLRKLEQIFGYANFFTILFSKKYSSQLRENLPISLRQKFSKMTYFLTRVVAWNTSYLCRNFFFCRRGGTPLITKEWSVRGSGGGGREEEARGSEGRAKKDGKVYTWREGEREEGSFNRPLLCAGDIFPAHYCI